MEFESNIAQPSLLIVQADERTRSFVEAFFSKVGWLSESISSVDHGTREVARQTFDLLITDASLLRETSLGLLREKSGQSSTVPVVVIVDKESANDQLIDSDDIFCCIHKDLEPVAIESSLQCLVGEIQRRMREGPPSRRRRMPAEAQIVIESFSSRELAESGYSFPILATLEEAGLLSLHERLRLRLALQEALANSLEHGNLGLDSRWREEIDHEGMDRYSKVKIERLEDPYFGERIITIVSDFDCERLLIRITDQGQGFDAPDGNILATGDSMPAVFGRGLAIMKSSVDEVTYGFAGRQVTLVKKIISIKEE